MDSPAIATELHSTAGHPVYPSIQIKTSIMAKLSSCFQWRRLNGGPGRCNMDGSNASACARAHDGFLSTGPQISSLLVDPFLPLPMGVYRPSAHSVHLMQCYGALGQRKLGPDPLSSGRISMTYRRRLRCPGSRRQEKVVFLQRVNWRCTEPGPRDAQTENLLVEQALRGRPLLLLAHGALMRALDHHCIPRSVTPEARQVSDEKTQAIGWKTRV